MKPDALVPSSLALAAALAAPVAHADPASHRPADPAPRRRLHLAPTVGVTVADDLVQHAGLGLAVALDLTPSLALVAEAHHYVARLRDRYDELAVEDRMVPAVNRYRYAGAVDLRWAPLGPSLGPLPLELSVIAGVGLTRSETIPRDPALAPFDALLPTGNAGAALRLPVGERITLEVGARDYVLRDRREAPDRTEVSAAAARVAGRRLLVHHVVLQLGVGLTLP